MDRVLTKNLEQGRLYVTDSFSLGTKYEGMGCTCLYLGKTPKSMGERNVWMFVGRVDDALQEIDIYNKINSIGANRTQPYCQSGHKAVYDFVYYERANKFKFDIDSPYLDVRIRGKILSYLKD